MCLIEIDREPFEIPLHRKNFSAKHHKIAVLWQYYSPRDPPDNPYFPYYINSCTSQRRIYQSAEQQRFHLQYNKNSTFDIILFATRCDIVVEV